MRTAWHIVLLQRRRGNALLMALVLLTLLAGLSAAQFSTQQKNLQQSRFYVSRAMLHKYAEAGIALGMHQVRYRLSPSPGDIGTDTWNPTMDHGLDGQPGTLDEGEGDGAPTPGEPGVFAQAIGPPNLQITVAVHSFDTGFANVKRIVSTSYDGESLVVLEKYLSGTVTRVPKVGALYVSPNVILDFNGNAFTVSGNDHFMNGFPTGDPAKALAGLATTTSDPPGTNYDALMAQIRLENYDQIEGAGGTPAVGEVEAFDLNQIAEQFLIAETQDLAPGTYTGLNIASLTPGNVVVTHVAGDLRLSGSGEGSGVLIVDGDLRVSGSFEFTGLVIVRGDMRAVGGGSGIHVIGGVMIGEPVDAQTPSEMKIAGNADFVYSSEVMDIIQGVLNDNPTYEGVYYDENRNPGTPGTPQETPQETTQDPAPQPAQ